MPFDSAVKMAMFIHCNRRCCLCLKQCGLNIEAAHIIDEAANGSNDENNGIPLCFDCHQEIGSYNDKHPRGNKIRPDELRARRDRVYSLVADGRIEVLQPANLPRLLDRRLELKTGGLTVANPTVAQVIVAVDKLVENGRDWNKSFLILGDCAWENAFAQVCKEDNQLFWAEYRDGATQLQYRTQHQIAVETVKLILLSYLHHGDALMRCAVPWEDVTTTLSS
jgi:HNH endonuclease